MSNKNNKRLLRQTLALPFLCMVLIFLPGYGLGQRSTGGIPASRQWNLDHMEVPVVSLTPPDLASLAQEDANAGMPVRFAVNLPCGIGLAESGNWKQLPDGSRICRLTITSEGAKALSLLFDRFNLPEGSTLHIYSDEMKQVLGAYTSANNESSGLFATQLIHDDRLTVEFHQASGLTQLPDIRISHVAYAYRGFGAAGPCEVNVNCEEGQNWQEVKKGVVRIQAVKSGSSFWCSGSLVNNTRNDGKPYVLSADHCVKGATEEDLNQWIFYFGYDAPGCENPTVPPQEKALTGAALKARAGDVGEGGSDFLLLLLNDTIPDDYDVYLNGWNRINIPSSSGVGIHHPQGDVKKISTYRHKVSSTNWTGGSIYTHWLVKWNETLNGHGVTEGGSSGSALFDSTGMIIGNLTGGASSCDSSNLDEPDYYGKFSYSWLSCGTDSTAQLQHWLDPDSTGTEILAGRPLYVPPSTTAADFQIFPNPASEKMRIGRIVNSGGRPMKVTFFNSQGTAVMSESRMFGGGQEEFDIHSLAPGFYIVLVTGEDRSRARKLIKQ